MKHIKENSTLYARIDYKIGEEVESEQVAHSCTEYLQKIAGERFLLAGLFGNIELGEMDGAMILFEAKNLEEAKTISDKDPIIKNGFYRYELKKWNVLLTSENTGS